MRGGPGSRLDLSFESEFGRDILGTHFQGHSYECALLPHSHAGRACGPGRRPEDLHISTPVTYAKQSLLVAAKNM